MTQSLQPIAFNQLKLDFCINDNEGADRQQGAERAITLTRWACPYLMGG